MASSTEQLSADFNEIQTTLELYPSINIIRVENQPPDSYEIEYLIKGCVRDADGTIRYGSQHRIRISLPFGYPHFPPTVKPLSPVFHPDIDPDAIRITAYWQKNPSLSDLILHIGEMISGNIYNLNDPFNQEAADWYAEHINELPLDNLQVADIKPDDEHLDPLIDDNFNLLGLEDDAAEEIPEKGTEQQLELVRLRIEQKEMFAARHLLADIPDSTPIPDRDEIEHVINSSLREGEELLDKAEQLEGKGQIDNALELVEQAARIAADTPELEDIRLRLQQAQVMAESFSETTPIPKISSPSSLSKSSPDTADGKKPKKKSSPKAALPRAGFTGLPFKRIVISSLLLLVGASGAVLYFRDTSLLSQAESNWQKAQSQLQNQQFKSADKSAQNAAAALAKVRVLRFKIDNMQADLTKFLNSPPLQKGLLGEIEYNGQYLPANTVAGLQKLRQLTVQAEQLIQENKDSEAIAAYETARDFARKNGFLPKEAELNHKINTLRFEEFLTSARKAEEAKEWQNAAATYQRALELSKTLSNADGTGEISKKLAAATFRHELDQSRTTFTEAQWQKTIEMLEGTKKLLADSPDTISIEERNELERLLADARLYQLLSLARSAYEKQDWDTAINNYQSSLDMLSDKQNIFTVTHDGDDAKIAKTILMISIKREQSAATEAEQKNDLKTAREHYKVIQSMIASSGFNKDSEIAAINKNAASRIRAQTAQLAMNKRISWLKKNYKKIFTEAYPSSRSSQLIRPKVTFVKTIKGQQVFQLTCVERSQGSSFRLEIKYQYNPANGRWSIYYDQ
jgi:ubiquitin-protein ligase